MAKYRKKPVVIEASQWFELGDHQKVNCWPIQTKSKCLSCGKLMIAHGRIKTLEGHHIVCPGDWIITGIKGEHYPCKPDIFEQTYERVNNDNNIK